MEAPKQIKLSEDALKWAITHLFRESDTDLFPRPYELKIIQDQRNALVNLCKDIDVGSYRWNAARRFIVPKDDISYRQATQLDLIDSVMFGALIYTYGNQIERRRIPESANIVFSYRFKPAASGTLYNNKNAWNDFWKECQLEARDFQYVVSLDISDFYNQIYHHTIENQLIESGLPNQAMHSIKNLLTSLTQKSSRGIPIGPHASHLLAEMSLIPFDESLKLKGIPFKRYADDIVLFCNTIKQSRIIINQVAEILDKQQRLVLQRQKTKVLKSENFQEQCKTILMETPENETEHEIIGIIKSYAGGDSYTKINLADIEDEDLELLSEDNIIKLLNSYLKTKKPNYEKIRWIYRRLSQIGIPHAVDYSIKNYEKLIPALNDVCLYLSSCGQNYKSDWKAIGKKILTMLKDEVVMSNEFYQISLLNLFVYNDNLNHFTELIKLFKRSAELIKRKILLASLNYNAGPWLSELKEDSVRFDVWTRRAYLIAAKKLPTEERDFFYKGVSEGLGNDDILEKIIIKWAKNKKPVSE
jgi:hypothetical protein